MAFCLVVVPLKYARSSCLWDAHCGKEGFLLPVALPVGPLPDVAPSFKDYSMLPNKHLYMQNGFPRTVKGVTVRYRVVNFQDLNSETPDRVAKNRN